MLGAKARPVDFEPPEQDLKLSGEMEDGVGVGERDAVGAGDLIEADFGLRGFERPRKVVNVADEHAAQGGGEETVTLREEVA